MVSRNGVSWFFTSLFALLMFGCKQDDPEPESNFSMNYPGYFNDPSIPTDNQLTQARVDLGRMLFYEKILSSDSSVSCASCHKQENAFSDTRRLSVGVEGRRTRRHSMAIVNLAWQTHFFWDGRANSLEEQALKPIEDENEMNLPLEEAISRLQSSSRYPRLFENAYGSSTITTQNLAKAIASFERTLISANSKFDKYKQDQGTLTEQERLGEQLFFTHPEPQIGLRGGNCSDCHGGLLTTDNSLRNNGLDSTFTDDLGLEEVTRDSNDRGKFKTVTLRNIELTAPYMHDGRFATLEEVLDHYNDHISHLPNVDPLIIEASNEFRGDSLMLTEDEKAAIIAFLKTLTDENFINNDDFSDPFD